MLVGTVLLWRVLNLATDVCACEVDLELLSELSSPGLNRAIKLTFEGDMVMTDLGR